MRKKSFKKIIDAFHCIRHITIIKKKRLRNEKTEEVDELKSEDIPSLIEVGLLTGPIPPSLNPATLIV